MNGSTHPSSRLPARANRALDWALRVVPVAALVAIAALFTAQQTVKPHHRAIKALVLLALVALMMRFDMVYSVYLFALLFVFPSGISIGSSNSVLMTVIPMLWAIRATSSKVPLLRRTPLDAPIALFLMAFIVSLFNVSDSRLLGLSLVAIWNQFAACAFFYCIVMFVDSEQKLFRLGKVMCVSCGLVMLTAVLELFFPGLTIIPGWIGVSRRLGEGIFTQRVQGLRVGGAFESHDMLSDFGSQMFLFMVFFALMSRNVIEKVFWLGTAGVTVVAILATANRGGTIGFLLALALALVHFRKRIGTLKVGLLAAAIVIGFVLLDEVISDRTVAVSVIDRFMGTTFEGVVPDNRTMTWKPNLIEALKKPFFGHGPYFDTGVGLTRRFWPHNGYLFFFYTLGLFGLLAFLWVLARVYRRARQWRAPLIRDTNLGRFMALSEIWFIVLLVEQMRTDHQRDDIYPFIVWMCFGVVVAGALIAGRRSGSGSPGDRQLQGIHPITRVGD
jgi:O-antigen ligase